MPRRSRSAPTRWRGDRRCGRAAQVAVEIIRTGSRGLYWLEPMVEVATPQGRVAYGRWRRAMSQALFDAGSRRRRAPLRLGPTEEIPWLKRQTRLTFARCGIIDPLLARRLRAHGGCKGLERALRAGTGAIVEEVDAVGPARPRRRRLPDRHQVEDGRSDAQADQKYIVCNADEGDSGTFADRMIMEGDPFVLIEGMTIAGIAVGATKGYIYIRSEYPHAIAAMKARIAVARRGGLLGATSRLSGTRSTWKSASAPAPMSAARRRRCSTAWKASAAWCAPSRRCRRIKGLFGKPTVINNVLSFASVPIILDEGRRSSIATSAWAARAARCRSSSPATSSMAVCSRPPSASRSASWSTISAAAPRSGRPVRAVQVGGPLGAYFPRALFDTPVRLRGLRGRATA